MKTEEKTNNVGSSRLLLVWGYLCGGIAVGICIGKIHT